MSDHNGNGSYGYSPYGGGGGASYGSGTAAPQQSYGSSYGYGSPYAAAGGGSSSPNATLRHRNVVTQPPQYTSSSSSPMTGSPGKSSRKSKMVKKLDFMYPKVESEFTVKTEKGGVTTLVMMALIVLLSLAEVVSYRSQNNELVEHIKVDTALGKQLRVNINITFPSLACEDLHVDAMDAAGDSQLNVEDTFVKKQLHLDGTPRSEEEIKVDMNAARKVQEEKTAILNKELPEDYCGPCYGAADTSEQCCQTCLDVENAYKKKRWRTDMLFVTAEQCVREGKDKQKPKKMTKNQGCNLSGYMTVNRVAGNFHIAMGEGLERDGRHIHSFLPEDTPNFNCSHIIHELTFGPLLDEEAPLNGVTKIITEETGTSGMVQYFIKVVPTTYKTPQAKQIAVDALPSLYEEVERAGEEGDDAVETNRYFFTERFRPLMSEWDDDEMEESEHFKINQDDHNKVELAMGGSHGHHAHGHHDHHKVQNSILPGVFFMYEIYPFQVEISQKSVPFTHLLVRLLATVGGVYTVFKWFDSFIYSHDQNQRSSKIGRY